MIVPVVALVPILVVPAPAVPVTPMSSERVTPPVPDCWMSRLVSGDPTPIVPEIEVSAVPERRSKF